MGELVKKYQELISTSLVHRCYNIVRPDNSSYSGLTDKELIALLKSDDRGAFDIIFGKYHGPLYVFALKFLKDSYAASDVIQDVFIKIFEHVDALPQNLDLKNYLFSMVRNKVYNYVRDNNKRLVHNYRISQQCGGLVDYSFMEEADEKTVSEFLTKAIDSLPPQQKKVASLRRSGLSNAEIADIMNLSLNTVNVHYRLCLRNLKDKLSGLEVIIVFLLCLY